MPRQPTPVFARFKARVCGRSPAWIVGSNPRRGHVCLSWVSGRGICVGLITRPEESYRVQCVCDHESSTMRRPWPYRGLFRRGTRNKEPRPLPINTLSTVINCGKATRLLSSRCSQSRVTSSRGVHTTITINEIGPHTISPAPNFMKIRWLLLRLFNVTGRTDDTILTCASLGCQRTQNVPVSSDLSTFRVHTGSISHFHSRVGGLWERGKFNGRTLHWTRPHGRFQSAVEDEPMEPRKGQGSNYGHWLRRLHVALAVVCSGENTTILCDK